MTDLPTAQTAFSVTNLGSVENATPEVEVMDSLQDARQAEPTSILPVKDGGIIDNVAEAIIDTTTDVLTNDDKKDDVAEVIDGATVDTRPDDQQDAIDETLDEVENGAFDIQVATVRNGYVHEYTTAEGNRIWFKLRRGDDAHLIETPDGELILLLSRWVAPEDVQEIVTEAVTQYFQDLAESNGVNFLYGFEERFLSYLSPFIDESVEAIFTDYQKALALVQVVETLSAEDRKEQLLSEKSNLQKQANGKK